MQVGSIAARERLMEQATAVAIIWSVHAYIATLWLQHVGKLPIDQQWELSKGLHGEIWN